VKHFQLLDAVKLLELDFSAGRNAMWGPDDAAYLLAAMSESSTCANQTVKRLRHTAPDDETEAAAVPSSAWLLGKLRSPGPDKMRIRCDAMLRYSATKAVGVSVAVLYRAGMAPVLAIDEHKIHRYDGKPDMAHLVKSKRDRGTVNFEEYITCKLVSKTGPPVHTACSPVTRDGEQADLVRKLLQNCVDLGVPALLEKRRSTVLLDRGFFSVATMSALRDSKFAFIMPAVRNAGIKRAIVEHASGKRPAVSLYTIQSEDG